MNSLQAKCNQLLIELTEFCEENDIEYGISCSTVKMAYLNSGYIDGSIDTRIEMNVAQARKLISCMEKNPISDRKLTYMGNHKKYPGFSLRYSDPNTLYLPLSGYTRYPGNDMGIEIVILRKYPVGPWKRKLLMALEVGWELNCDLPLKKQGKKKFLCKIGVGFLRTICGSKRLGRWLFQWMMKQYDSKPDDTLCIRRAFKKLVKLPKRAEEKHILLFEGREYPCLENIEKYLVKILGEKWRDSQQVGEKPGAELIVDDSINFEMLDSKLQKKFDLNKFIRKHIEVKRGISLRGPYFRRKMVLWKKAMNVGLIMETESEYLRSGDYRENLIENHAYEKLEKYLGRYQKILSGSQIKSCNSKLKKELLPSCVLMLQIQGKKALALQLKKSKGK